MSSIGSIALPERPENFLQRHRSVMSGTVMGGVVLALIIMLVVPLSTTVLDVAIAVNLCASVLVLLTAFYLHEPVRLPSFPTIILVTTLFRLAINVSSTRLILGNGDAGHIIQTFGDFAAGGNIIVGAVVFIVLTIVQFMVISKGAERVAEVGARFTLDAMQGKQLSIDADLSSDRISPEEAKRQRTQLALESKLHGSMDGAMKFVKGDAIAGIIVTAVNVIAGFVVGIVTHNMSAAESAEVYTVLSVGDGLVSQIPSLLISVSAALVLTRIAARDDKNSNAASDMAAQLGQLPGALLGSSAIMILVAATSGFTGFPPIPFLALGALLIGLGAWVLLHPNKGTDGGGDAYTGKPARKIDLELITADRIGVRIGATLFQSAARPRIEAALRTAVTTTSRDRGLPMPAPALAEDDRFPEGYAIYLRARLCAQVALRCDQAVALCTPEAARAAGARQPTPFTVVWQHANASRIDAGERAACEARGIVVLSVEEAMAEHLRATLTINAGDFASLQDVFHLVEAVKRSHPDLVNHITNGGRSSAPIPTIRIADTLRLLADDLVPLRDLPLVLAGLSSIGSATVPQETLAESVRAFINPLIVASAESAPGTIHTVTLSLSVAKQLAQFETATPETVARFMTKWNEAGFGTGRHPTRLAILVPTLPISGSEPLRPAVRRTLRDALPLVPVLSTSDLPPSVNRVWAGAISDLGE